MAISKKFEAQVLSLNTKGKAAAEALQALGADAVRKAYSNQDSEWATFMLQKLPSYMREPLARWFKKAGLNVVGDQCTGAIDSKAQNRAFKFIESTPVLVCDAPVRAETEKAPLEGTGEERAREALGKLVKRLKKDDPEAATAANNIVSRPEAQAERGSFIDLAGAVIRLSQSEAEQVSAFIMSLRVPKNTPEIVKAVKASKLAVDKADAKAGKAKLQQLKDKLAA